VRLLGRPKVANFGVITIGERTRIDSTTVRSEFASFPGGRLEIGAGVYINYGASMAAHCLIRIGDGCTIGTHAILMDNDYHGIEDRFHLPPSEPIVLEQNVWLGARVIVLKGVTVGRDSVIGAGSVVTKSIPPRCVAAGVPARILRQF
jgi:maltose O-acetyltransferase